MVTVRPGGLFKQESRDGPAFPPDGVPRPLDELLGDALDAVKGVRVIGFDLEHRQVQGVGVVRPAKQPLFREGRFRAVKERIYVRDLDARRWCLVDDFLRLLLLATGQRRGDQQRQPGTKKGGSVQRRFRSAGTNRNI